MKTLSNPWIKTDRGLSLTAMPLALLVIPPASLFARTTASGIVSGETPQGTKFMSGGVGLEEREQMLRSAPNYDLDLSFADRRGDYLSDINLTVTDEPRKAGPEYDDRGSLVLREPSARKI